MYDLIATFNEQQFEKIKAAAEQARMPLSDYLVHAVMQHTDAREIVQGIMTPAQ
jgi:hypothetical protein